MYKTNEITAGKKDTFKWKDSFFSINLEACSEVPFLRVIDT